MKIPVNKSTAVALIAVALVGVAIWIGWRATADPVAEAAARRTLMDAETGELVEIRVDERFSGFPVVNPGTGRSTLYPTETCRSEVCAARGGTPVILNSYLGKEGPTHCPVCRAEARFHNGGRE
jgi:hypothetical protein